MVGTACWTACTTGRLLHGFDNGRRGLLDRFRNGSALLNRFDHGSCSLLHGFNHGSRGFLYCFGDGSHALDLFFNILTGGGIKNLECCHLFSAALSPRAVQGSLSKQ